MDNGERYISWRTFLTWAVPSIISMSLALAAFTVWLLNAHTSVPHPDAVSYREFQQLKDDIKDIKEQVREINKK